MYNYIYIIGLQGDMEKCFNTGKSIIIEGSHIDPSLYTDFIKNDFNIGIVVPIYLTMNNDDHRLSLEQWLYINQVSSF